VHTSIHVEGANCPNCFNDTIEVVAQLDGVEKVFGSFAGPCIEVDHDETVINKITEIIQAQLHGIAMYADEAGMTPIKISTTTDICTHHRDTNENDETVDVEMVNDDKSE
jgi:copper chaperone CopZ